MSALGKASCEVSRLSSHAAWLGLIHPTPTPHTHSSPTNPAAILTGQMEIEARVKGVSKKEFLSVLKMLKGNPHWSSQRETLMMDVAYTG